MQIVFSAPPPKKKCSYSPNRHKMVIVDAEMKWAERDQGSFSQRNSPNSQN